MTTAEIQKQLLDDFVLFGDWTEKYQHIIDMGKELEELPGKFKKDVYLIPGCQSQVWLGSEATEDGNIHFFADSDAAITKGLIALLLKIFNDHTPREILDTEITLLDDIGLAEQLTPSRANGLVAMLKTIRTHAEAYLEA